MYSEFDRPTSLRSFRTSGAISNGRSLETLSALSVNAINIDIFAPSALSVVVLSAVGKRKQNCIRVVSWAA